MSLAQKTSERIAQYIRSFDEWHPLRATLRAGRHAPHLLYGGVLKEYFQYRLHKPLTIVVLGMHRSGTSFTTRAINLLGAHVGSNLVGSDSYNEYGHWEHKYSLDINKKILNYAGGSWDRPPKKIESKVLFRLRIKLFLSKLHKGGAKPAVWKDPRTLLTFPVWKREIVNYLPVFVFRHPVSVASSLRKRNNFTVNKGLSLWLKYNRNLIDIDDREEVSFFIDFDGGLDHITAVLKKISKMTGLYFDQSILESYKRNIRSSDRRESLKGEIDSVYRELRERAD